MNISLGLAIISIGFLDLGNCLIADVIKYAKSARSICLDGTTYFGLLTCIATLKLLPLKLQHMLHDAQLSGINPSALRRLQNLIFTHSALVEHCSLESTDIKSFHLCILKEVGMNPFNVRIFECMDYYVDWIEWSPMDAEEEVTWQSAYPVPWTLLRFQQMVERTGNERIISSVRNCKSKIQRDYSALAALEAMYIDDDIHEQSIKGFLMKFGTLLFNVPIPFGVAPQQPSDILPLIFRHYSLSIKHQRVIDGIIKDKRLWKSLNVILIEPIIKSIQSSSSKDHALVGPEYKNYGWQPWWFDLFSILWKHPSCNQEALFESVVRAYGAPQRLHQVIWKSLQSQGFDGNYAVLVNGINVAIAEDMRKNFPGIPGYISGNDLESLEELSTYHLRLVELWSKLFPKATIPHTHQLIIEMLMLKLYQMDGFSLEWAIIFLHPRSQDIQEAIAQLIVTEGNSKSVAEYLKDIWDPRYCYLPDSTEFYDELKAILGIDNTPYLSEDLGDFMAAIRIEIIDSINANRGDALKTLTYGALRNYSRKDALLDLIQSSLKSHINFATWITLNMMAAKQERPWNLAKDLIYGQFETWVDICVNGEEGEEFETSLIQEFHNLLLSEHHIHESLYLGYLESLSLVEIEHLVDYLKRDSCKALVSVFDSRIFQNAALWRRAILEAEKQLGVQVIDRNVLYTPLSKPFSSLLERLRDPNATRDPLKDHLLDAKESLEIFHSRNPDNSDLKEECPICAHPYTPRNPVRALRGCKHYFHRGCIRRAMQAKNSCPICREPIRTELERHRM